jgi:thymidylate kinase
MNQRKEFLHYFFNAIRDNRYALLKYVYSSLDEIPESSDVDLIVDRHDLAKIIAIIHSAKNIDKIHSCKKSYVSFISILFSDGTYLEIDLIHRIERKGIIFLEAEELLEKSYTNEQDINVVSLAHNFEYIVLFHLINKANVPSKYVQYFDTLSAEQRSEIFAHISEKHTVHLNVLDELYNPKERNSKKLIREIYHSASNKSTSLFFHKIRYARDVMREMLYNKGIVITFSGVDGAGKSTVIEHIDEILKTKYRKKTVVLRHRPSMLPILSAYKYGKKAAEKRTTRQLPRQGTNTNGLSSFCRFLYYYTDYFFGQFYILFNYSLRGYTVIYDRYYFDFIIDAKRSNIVLPKPILRGFYYFLFKPAVNVFLFAPEEIILERKNELSKEDIIHLTNDYRLLFDEYTKSYKKQSYLTINNTRLENTLDLVIDKCIAASF